MAKPENSQILDDYSLVALARSAREDRHLSQLYAALGAALPVDTTHLEVFNIYNVAHRLDPKNAAVRKIVAAMRQAKRQ